MSLSGGILDLGSCPGEKRCHSQDQKSHKKTHSRGENDVLPLHLSLRLNAYQAIILLQLIKIFALLYHETVQKFNGYVFKSLDFFILRQTVGRGNRIFPGCNTLPRDFSSSRANVVQIPSVTSVFPGQSLLSYFG
jgi:hypothetical protein